MRIQLLWAASVISLATTAFFLGVSYGASSERQVKYYAPFGTTCNPGAYAVFVDEHGKAMLYVCSETDTWRRDESF